jgi:uncharacterized membrane protein YsdA (DUF1294 family)/cold shock CspA family protein
MGSSGYVDLDFPARAISFIIALRPTVGQAFFSGLWIKPETWNVARRATGAFRAAVSEIIPLKVILSGRHEPLRFSGRGGCQAGFLVLKIMATLEKRAMRKLPPMNKGTLVMWNDPKGFGFVRPENSEDDYFIHITAFKKEMARRPEIGDTVRFRPADIAGKKRVSFAIIEGIDYEQPAPKPFSLMPKPRSWAVNLLILTPLTLSAYLLWRAKNPIPFFSYCVFSLLTLFIYGADKTHAATRRWRVPEIYLHVLELMGGWPGALMAQNAFRHKTRKSLYQVLFRGIIALHLAAWGAYFYWSFLHNAL